jgi:glutathione gamma-glutamylcysteinyltransferase
MTETFHRRPLPSDLVAFGSPEGRALLAGAMAAGTAEPFFPLVAHLHTQAEPAWCGLGTLVTVLNALEIDPGRPWKGAWRFFGEELLVCCKSLAESAADGLSLDEVACLAQCNGADAEVARAEDPTAEATFRAALDVAVRAPAGPFLVANYARTPLGQTGSGHFSPLAAWHPETDRVLVLDVARFKYPPHWVPVARLVAAMATLDPETGRTRGWLRVGRALAPVPPADVDLLVNHLRRLGACPPEPVAPLGVEPARVEPG